jgi:hypothetical protein
MRLDIEFRTDDGLSFAAGIVCRKARDPRQQS